MRELDLTLDYAGHDYDSVLGVYHAKARMYDGASRRFMSVDPVKGSAFNPMSLLPYTYCLDNPLKYVDPLGMAVTIDDSVGVSASHSTAMNQRIAAEAIVLQTKLNNLGYNLAVDGSYGPKTIAMIEAFQRSQGLVVDGNAGPQTINSLNQATADRIANDDSVKYVGGKFVSVIKSTSPICTNGPVKSSVASSLSYQGVFPGNMLNNNIYYNSVACHKEKTDMEIMNQSLLVLNKSISGLVEARVVTDTSKTFRVVDQILTPIPYLPGANKTINAVDKALDSGKNIKFLSNANSVRLGRNSLYATQSIGKVGNAAGVLGTIITPFTELDTSISIVEDNLEIVNMYGTEEEKQEALILGTVIAVGDAASFGFGRSVMKTPFALIRIIPGEDPKWTDSYDDVVNKCINAESFNKNVVTPVIDFFNQ